MNRVLITALLCAAASLACAWDYEGHRTVNQLAIESLPKNFPAFALTPAARERIAFLSGEADRWRNSTNHAARHCLLPEHYLDLEHLPDYGISPKALPPFRYEFVVALAEGRLKHHHGVNPPLAEKDTDHSRHLAGFLPWSINDYYAKLESGFSYLKTFEQHGGTPEEIQNAQMNIIYIMGVMGHFVGDAGQPLHTTKHFNGWVGENPNNYATNQGFHSWIDGGFIKKSGLTFKDLQPQVRPARVLWGVAPTNIVADAVNFIIEQNALVEPLYKLNKKGALSPPGEAVEEGKKFIGGQLLKSGQFLGDLWYSAWAQAPIDKFLKTQLGRRENAEK
jgi:hypothetical protein